MGFFFQGKRKIDILIAGLYLFYVGMMLHEYFFFNSKWPLIISLLSVCMVIWGYISIEKNLCGCDNLILPIYKFLLLISSINVSVGVLTYHENLSLILFNQQYLWMFMVPFFLMVPIDFIILKRLLKWALIYVITSLCFSFINFNDFFFNAEELLLSATEWEAFVVNRPQEPALLLYPISAFLPFMKFLNKKWKVLIFVSSILAIGAGLLSGRRSVIAVYALLLLIPFFVVVLKSKRRFLIASTIVFGGLIVSLEYNIDKVFENSLDEYFPVLSQRMYDDTRSETEYDFYQDMSDPLDWIIGRGMNGTYRSPAASYVDRLDRQVIETGYLNMILHGGLLLLIPFVVLLLYAFYKGFFYSNNFFLKNSAFYILLHIFMLYPDGTPKLTLEYFILFMFIRICISEEWRNMSMTEICHVMIDDNDDDYKSLKTKESIK